MHVCVFESQWHFPLWKAAYHVQQQHHGHIQYQAAKIITVFPLGEKPHPTPPLRNMDQPCKVVKGQVNAINYLYCNGQARVLHHLKHSLNQSNVGEWFLCVGFNSFEDDIWRGQKISGLKHAELASALSLQLTCNIQSVSYSFYSRLHLFWAFFANVKLNTIPTRQSRGSDKCCLCLSYSVWSVCVCARVCCIRVCNCVFFTTHIVSKDNGEKKAGILASQQGP